MSFYSNATAYISGGSPGAVVFVDPASPNPGTLTTDSFFTFDPANDRLRIWGGVGAGVDIGTGAMRLSLTGSFGLGIGTQAGTNYFNVGTGPGANTNVRGVFQNLGIGGASTDALLDVSGQWLTTGSAHGIRLNVTDSASAAGSQLIDLQVGGTTRFRVDKAGNSSVATITSSGTSTGPETVMVTLGNQTGALLQIGRRNAAAALATIAQGGFGPTYVTLEALGTFSWSNTNLNSGATADLFIWRDAANILAQRNGIISQTFRIYNTFTDFSNYERGVFSWVSNALNIGTQNAGTGLSRNVEIVSGGISALTISTSGAFVNTGIYGNGSTVDVGSNSFPFRNVIQDNGYHQMTEMVAPAAPAVNSVRIYAEDNGAGKTRLMARFNTGAAQQIAIEP